MISGFEPDESDGGAMTDDATETGNAGKSELVLHCFGEIAPPAQVVEGWKRLLGFPQQARAGLWALLGSALLEPASPDFRERLEAFCREHALAERHVVEAVQACDVLIRQASALDLDRDRFGQDLDALSDRQGAVPQDLLSRYDSLKDELRRRMVQGSLADHGKVLVGLDWRVDKVVSSDRGAQLDTDVVLLTLRYREGERLERITLQLTQETLRELRLFTERISDQP
jgi:hypothetical protein